MNDWPKLGPIKGPMSVQAWPNIGPMSVQVWAYHWVVFQNQKGWKYLKM